MLLNRLFAFFLTSFVLHNLASQHVHITQTYLGKVIVAASELSGDQPYRHKGFGPDRSPDSVWICQVGGDGKVSDSVKVSLDDIASFQYFGTPEQLGIGELPGTGNTVQHFKKGDTGIYVYPSCHHYRSGCYTGGIVEKMSCSRKEFTVLGGRVISMDIYSKYSNNWGKYVPWHLARRIQYEYDQKGFLCAEKVYDATGNGPATVVTYTYGKKGRLEKLSSLAYVNGQADPRNNESFCIHYFYDGGKLVYKVFRDYLSPELPRASLDSLYMLFDRYSGANMKYERRQDDEDISDRKMERLEAMADTSYDVLDRFLRRWPLYNSKGSELTRYVYEGKRLVTVRVADDSNDAEEVVEASDSFLYDKKGRLVSHSSYDWLTLYEWNSVTGQLTHVVRTDRETSQITNQEWYTYDAKGRISTIRIAQLYGPDNLELRLRYEF